MPTQDKEVADLLIEREAYELQFARKLEAVDAFLWEISNESYRH